ncbi:MAG TPA: MaoC/PaaZ C-terminal domain-containing protein [Candidatus Dormibacteraeota bacterium]
MGGTWTTRRRTVSAADLAAFAGAAGEMSPLLIDEPHARAGLFRGQVAPGTFVAAAAVGLGSVDVPLPATVGMVGMSWKFLKPVRPGDTVQTRWRLFRKRSVENPAWGLAFWHIDVLDAEGERLAEGEVSRLVQRRSPGASAPVSAEAPARPRRRRRRGGSADRVTEVVESAPMPEPAPADAPPPSRRRRRRGGSRNGSAPRQETVVASSPEPPPAPAAAKPSGLGGVLRRLRGS